jgi:hypothetical protein
VDDKQNFLMTVTHSMLKIDSLNYELKELSKEKKASSKIVRAVMQEAEESMGINIVHANNSY